MRRALAGRRGAGTSRTAQECPQRFPKDEAADAEGNRTSNRHPVACVVAEGGGVWRGFEARFEGSGTVGPLFRRLLCRGGAIALRGLCFSLLLVLPPPPDSTESTGSYRALKRVLRFLPRRAVLHRYPLIGRFADSLRPRSYLWSIRRPEVRRACYAGSVIAFLPLFGIQLPLALLAALLLRCNFMVMGGLQFITNPLTAGPIYFLTHALGVAVLGLFSPAASPPITEEAELVALSGYVAGTIGEPLSSAPDTERWTTRARSAIGAMLLGGTILGLCGGVLLDLLDRALRGRRGSDDPDPRPAG